MVPLPIRLHDVPSARHLGWDNALAPAAVVAPGDEVELLLADCFDGQLGTAASVEDVASLDLGRANPLTGPVMVDGARPGDAVRIEVLDVEVSPIGWTTVIPGFGLLADEFPDPHVVVSRTEDGRVRFGELAELESRPFIGTLGVMPAEAGTHSVIPPRNVGGNLDCREVRPGSCLWLPVEVEGAGISAGDGHAAQGDGEVCGTAVETAVTVRLRIELVRDAALTAPRLELAGPVSTAGGGVLREREPQRVAQGRPRAWMTLGIGPDLYAGARDATRSMIELLGSEHRLAAADAYALCSVAGHLRIVEVVDAPNWVVGMELDPGVLA